MFVAGQIKHGDQSPIGVAAIVLFMMIVHVVILKFR